MDEMFKNLDDDHPDSSAGSDLCPICFSTLDDAEDLSVRCTGPQNCHFHRRCRDLLSAFFDKVGTDLRPSCPKCGAQWSVFYNRTNLIDHEHIKIYTIFPLPNIDSCLILEALFKQNIYEMSNFYLIFRCAMVLDQVVGQRCHVRPKASVRIRLAFSFNASEQAMASNCSETSTGLYLVKQISPLF